MKTVTGARRRNIKGTVRPATNHRSTWGNFEKANHPEQTMNSTTASAASTTMAKRWSQPCSVSQTRHAPSTGCWISLRLDAGPACAPACARSTAGDIGLLSLSEPTASVLPTAVASCGGPRPRIAVGLICCACSVPSSVGMKRPSRIHPQGPIGPASGQRGAPAAVQPPALMAASRQASSPSKVCATSPR
jgi:hypothetical protein